MRVNFFIAGVQKSGTTALDAMLREHPKIQMSRAKEVHFFDDDHVNWSDPNLERLHSAFDWTKVNLVRGEATPIYMYWQNALRRLKAYNPEAKIIVGLRHPTFRAYSHWRMEIARGAERLSFAEAVTVGRSRVTAAPNGQDRTFSYVERGFYERQIEELKSLFPVQQILFFRTDSLWANPAVELARIERFLGVEPLVMPNQTYIVPLRYANIGPMDDFVRSYLDELFHPTINVLRVLTGLKFEDWERPDYSEPMAPA